MNTQQEPNVRHEIAMAIHCLVKKDDDKALLFLKEAQDKIRETQVQEKAERNNVKSTERKLEKMKLKLEVLAIAIGYSVLEIKGTKKMNNQKQLQQNIQADIRMFKARFAELQSHLVDLEADIEYHFEKYNESKPPPLVRGIPFSSEEEKHDQDATNTAH